MRMVSVTGAGSVIGTPSGVYPRSVTVSGAGSTVVASWTKLKTRQAVISGAGSFVGWTREISDDEYAAWLDKENEPRCVLIEARHSTGTIYLTNYVYVSDPYSNPANTPYTNILKTVPAILSSIDGDSTIGKVEILNYGGGFDSWLDLAWRGWPLDVYLGSPDWNRNEFRLIVSGINGGIASPNRTEINFELRDKKELLQENVQLTLMADGNPTPLSIGTVFNIEPVVENSANLIYRFHEDGLAAVSEARSNGAVLTPAVDYNDLGDGTLQLLSSPQSARITCDVAWATDLSPADIVEVLALRASGITAADLDPTNMAAFPATYSSGIYIKDVRPIADCIKDVMLSVGGAIMFTRLGKLQMKRLEAPGTASLDIGQDEVIERQFSVIELEEPRKLITLGYQKNWAVQDIGTLAGTVSVADQELYSSEHSVVTSDNSAVLTHYPLALDPDIVVTLIETEVDAQTECDRRKNLRAVKRIQYSVEVSGTPFAIEVGDTITLTHDRFGFSAGRDALVIGMKEQPTKNRVTLEIWL